MSRFPAEPVPSAIFMEEFVPSFFAEVELDEEERAVDLKVGVVLRSERGEGEPASAPDPGGEWTLHFARGELSVSGGRDEACEVTLVQHIADWRAALWEGRPALIAENVSRIAAAGPDGLRSPPGLERPRTPTELKGFSDIQGLVEMVISDPAASDWRLGVRVGAGPIPDSPQATILLGAAQAEAIRLGDLHPLEALITGELRLEGDLGLILQLQAVAMTASMAAGSRR